MNEPRTGYGLVALRKRFVNRAEVLTNDEGFVSDCAKERLDWNTRLPHYQLFTALDDHGMPLGLARAYPTALSSFEASERYNHPDDPEASARDLYEDSCSRIERRSKDPTLQAYDEWLVSILRLADIYYPACDFPVLSDNGPHPASVFLGHAINGPRVKDLRNKADGLIAEIRLDVLDATLDEDDAVLALGLYPGITPNDIKEAAVAIAAAVNHRYRDRLPFVRMTTLRDQGLTYEAIGAQLGLTPRAVMDALANRLPD